MKYRISTGSSYILSFVVDEELIGTCYHSGTCDDDIEWAMSLPEIKEQMDAISDEELDNWTSGGTISSWTTRRKSTPRPLARRNFPGRSSTLPPTRLTEKRRRWKMSKRRTNWDRVRELNEILGPVREFTGYYFSLITPRWMFKYPYALCYKMSPEHSLDFKGMRAMALRMRAAYDNGGDKTAIYKARYAY